MMQRPLRFDVGSMLAPTPAFVLIAFSTLSASAAMAADAVGQIVRVHFTAMLRLHPRLVVFVATHAGVRLVVLGVGVARFALDTTVTTVVKREDVVFEARTVPGGRRVARRAVGAELAAVLVIARVTADARFRCLGEASSRGIGLVTFGAGHAGVRAIKRKSKLFVRLKRAVHRRDRRRRPEVFGVAAHARRDVGERTV